MKTKLFFMILILSGIGLTQLSAQNGKNGSGTTSFEAEFGPWTVPVYCGGVISDYVTSPNLIVKITTHYVNGVVTWATNKVESLEWTSSSGEVYKGEAMFDHIRFEKGYGITHSNLIGDKGNKITAELKFDTVNWELIDIKSNCH